MPLILNPEDESIRRAPLLTLAKTGDQAQTDEFAGSQGAKFHLALGEQSPGADVLSDSISTGNSYQYKKLLQDRDMIVQEQTRADILSSIMQADPTAITPEVVGTVQSLSTMELASKDIGSIVEQKYAQFYTTTAAAALDNDVFDDAQAADPEGTNELLDRAEGLAFKRNYAKTIYDQIQQESGEVGLLGRTGDFLEQLIPGVVPYQTYNQVGDTTGFVSSVLPGSNREEQYAYMWSLGPEEFKTTLDTIKTDLMSRNTFTAQQWIEGLFSYGSADSFMDSAFAVADIATLAPVKTFANALKNVTKASSRNPMKLEKIATELGKNADAAAGKNIEDIKSGDFLNSNIRNAKEFENSIPSASSPDKLLVGADNVPQATYLRMKEAILARADLMKRFLLEPNLIDRATPEELINYRDILLQDYVRQNPSIQKNVIDATVDPSPDVGNVYQAKIILGRRDGTLFESEKQAQNWAKKYLDTTDIQIPQKGDGWMVVVNKAVDESRFLNDLVLGTTQRTPESIANTFGGLVRSPNYLVSEQQELARSTAVTSYEALDHIFSQLSEPFRKLQKKQLAELQDLMVDNRQKIQYHENYGEFSQAFYDRFKKQPSVEQADTYFAYVQINDLDLAVRDLDWYKQKSRLGLEDMTVAVVDDAGKRVDRKFEGKVIDRLPYGSKDRFSVSIVKDGVAKKPTPSKFINESLKAEIEKLVAAGHKIVQVSDSSFKVGDRYASFIVTDSLKRDRIGLLNVDRKPGGHKVHKYPGYIKQGMISADEDAALYRGDRSLWNVTSEKEGRELVELLEIARKKVVNNDKDAAQFIRDNLPISPKEFFTSVSKGEIDLSQPFVFTKKGIRTIDTGAYQHIKNLTDLGKNEHNLSAKITGSYAGERSLNDINIIRAEGDTLFVTEPAPYLDPMETLRMASNNMLSTRGMNDYTIMTHQNYLREFGDILKGTREEQMASGVSLLQDPLFKTGASPERMAAAKNVSRAYNNLMNHGTQLDRKIDLYKERILQGIMPKFGPRGKQWAEDRMLARVQDPGAYFRTGAFHMKLGLFNPNSYFTQLNSVVNIVAIAGQDGMRGGLSYPIARVVLASASDDILKRGGQIAEKVGLMKADEFVEGITLYKKSGYNNVGGDTSYLDNIKAPELSRGNIGKGLKATLDAGTIPFKEGERTVRIAAFMAAYLERKKALKGAALTRRDEAVILQRAKDLGGNMSRESNASWQKGYGATVTQFFGYQARIAEQFIGKKLTHAEKIRLFTAYSAVYGVPTAVGSTMAVLQMRDLVMQVLYANGEDPNGTWAEVFTDGAVAGMIEYITGWEPDIAGRYGPQGLPTLLDLFRADKTWSDVMLGASGSIAIDTLMDSYPMFRAMASEFSDFEGGYYNLTPDSFLGPLRNISTVNNAASLWNVWNFHIWASKNGTDITKMDLPDAVVAVITGLKPASIEDGFFKYKASKDFKEDQAAAQKDFIRQIRSMMKMDVGATRDAETKRIKALMVLEGFDASKIAQTWKYAADREMMVDVFGEKYDEMVQQQESAKKAIKNMGAQ